MISHGKNIKIFTANASSDLAKKIAEHLGVSLGDAQVGKFSDGEIYVNINETVRGSDVFVVQSTCTPVNNNLMELLIMIDACKRASAGRITAVIPYFGYARQDRKAKSRDPISAKLVANMLVAAGVDRVLTMDLHADQIQGFFDVPVDALYASGIFVPYIKSLNIENLSIAAPDMGGAKRANTYSKLLGTPIIISHKERAKANVVGKMTAIGDVEGRNVLIIDDIQELTGKTGTQNAFFNIFNHLQLAGKQLILTSDKPPVELKDIEQRLLTRFKWGLSAQLNTPDYDTKLKIIRAKAQKLGAQITDDVVAYLADNISANVREIEGALSSLVANASFLGRKITTSLAKEILKVYVKLYQKEITIDHIIEVVCEYLNLDFARFNSTERTREIAQARQIAMYLAKQHTKAPLTTIGSAIGGRNHATVLHSCKAVTNLIETDKAFRRQVEEIEKKVLAQ